MTGPRSFIDMALVPARGGSKGLPGKNIRLLGGRPLIAWTIQAARESGAFVRIVVSTDDPDIATAAREAGAETPFLRPAHLASDTAGSREVVEHALGECPGVASFALLQPTSPFRTATHIRTAITRFAGGNVPAVIGAAAAKPLSWSFAVDAGGAMTPAFDGALAARRQDEARLVQPNGSLYLIATATFQESGSLIPAGSLALIMDAVASLDIDGPEDMRIAEALVASGYPDRAP